MLPTACLSLAETVKCPHCQECWLQPPAYPQLTGCSRLVGRCRTVAIFDRWSALPSALCAGWRSRALAVGIDPPLALNSKPWLPHTTHDWFLVARYSRDAVLDSQCSLARYRAVYRDRK